MAMVLVPGSGSPAAVPLGPAAEIDARIKRWKREMVFAAGAPSPERAEERYRAVAGELRSRLWDPVISSLKGAQQVFIVIRHRFRLIMKPQIIQAM